jgi:hypothetical protein
MIFAYSSVSSDLQADRGRWLDAPRTAALPIFAVSIDCKSDRQYQPYPRRRGFLNRSQTKGLPGGFKRACRRSAAASARRGSTIPHAAERLYSYGWVEAPNTGGSVYIEGAPGTMNIRNRIFARPTSFVPHAGTQE